MVTPTKTSPHWNDLFYLIFVDKTIYKIGGHITTTKNEIYISIELALYLLEDNTYHDEVLDMYIDNRGER